jgi:hypothetical protein
VNLGFLRPMYEQIGDYVSVYLDTDRTQEKSLEAIDDRWRAAREDLIAAGASEASLVAVGAAITGGTAALGRALFARDGELILTGVLDGPPRREIARLAPLPHVMPLLAQHRPPIPHLRVSATETGGEIVAVGGSGDEWRDWVAGKQWPVHKTSVGGLSQDRHQRNVEETWNANAKQLAAEMVKVASRIGAQHVIVAGSAQIRTLVLEHLPKLMAESAAVFEEEVSADSPAMADAADRALAQWADRDVRQRFDDWRTHVAHGLGVEGLAATMAALRDGQVADLFVVDDASSTAIAWIGPAGQDLAVTQQDLLERDVPAPVTDRADAAIARAIATTDAELHFLPEDLAETGDPAAAGGIAHPRDGVCATLRFSERA